MVDLDGLPDDEYEAITGKKRKRIGTIAGAFGEYQSEGRESFLDEFVGSGAPSKECLQKAAAILRQNGYMVVNKRKNRR